MIETINKKNKDIGLYNNYKKTEPEGNRRQIAIPFRHQTIA